MNRPRHPIDGTLRRVLKSTERGAKFVVNAYFRHKMINKYGMIPKK